MSRRNHSILYYGFHDAFDDMKKSIVSSSASFCSSNHSNRTVSERESNCILIGKNRILYPCRHHLMSSSNPHTPTINRRQSPHPVNTINVRYFSKFSTDSNEVVVQDSDSQRSTTQELSTDTPATSTISSAKETANTKPSIDYLKPATAKTKQLLALKESYLTLSKTCIDAQKLLKNNVETTTSDELVAMADYFLILVNNVELETSIDTIQNLQYNENFVDGDSVTQEVLKQALMAMYRLHNIFIKVVEYCVPNTNEVLNSTSQIATNEMHSASFVPSSTKYSALAMGRALQVSRRAEELGMPMHRPMYKRMAAGIVLTSPLPLPMDPGQWPWDRENTNASELSTSSSVSSSPNLAPPGHSQQVKEGIYTPQVTMELLNLCHRAKVALKCSFSPSMPIKDQIEQSRQQTELEVDLYTEPWLLMLKRRQFEDALSLLQKWQNNFSSSEYSQAKPNIALLHLLGEDTVMSALDIAKNWIVGTSFPDHISSNQHANELINMLQHSLGQILRRRKIEADKMKRVIDALAIHAATTSSENEENEFSDSDTDSDDEFEEYDSDMEDEEDDNVISELTIDDITPENFPLLLKGAGLENPESNEDALDETKSSESTGENNLFLSARTAKVDRLDPASVAREHIKEAKDGEPPIIEGLSNKEVRQSIYLRKGPDWELPDIVLQLEDWNKGKPLNFTLEYEKHLAEQMMREDDDHWN